jgi:glutaminase
MKSPIPDYLKVVLDNARANEDGAPAGYIETLAKADTSKMAVALAMVDGKVYSAGDDEVEFSIQVSHGPVLEAFGRRGKIICDLHKLIVH